MKIIAEGTFENDNIVTAVVARSNSKRLPGKALKPFRNELLITGLMERVSKVSKSSSTILATTYLEEDDELCDIVEQKGYKVYRGDPVSVIDRLLNIAEKYKAHALYKVTGDNPFTDPELMNLMANILIKNNLDYVRANNLPLGISGELYSANYLRHLYQTMDDPDKSEYLTWYALKDDKGKKGCISIKSEIKDLNWYRITVDYEEDYVRCLRLMQKIGKDKISEVQLKDIIINLNILEKMDASEMIKLPGKRRIKYKKYLEYASKVNYLVREEVLLK